MNDSEAEFLREMELLGFNKAPQLDIVGMPTIKSSELVKVRKIGSGQYGDVYEGIFDKSISPRFFLRLTLILIISI